MKTLYESLLSDFDTLDRNNVHDILVKSLFSKDLQQRRKGFDNLLSMVESYRPKEHKTTAKMKSSDSYFVEFSRPIKIENGEPTNEVLDYISFIQVCKQTGSEYRTTIILASDDMYATHSNFVHIFEVSWIYTQPNFNPKALNTKLYEVPEELNELFRQIQMEAYNHR